MIAAPADAGAAVIFSTPSGDIAGGQTQTGRIDRTLNPASTCAAPDPFESVVEDEDQFRFRNHTFSSSLTEPVCITVDVNSTSPCTELYSAAYVEAFDRFNPGMRRAGDMGDENGLDPYSFTVPARSPFGVVVHETVPGGACTAYSITVSSQGPWARSRPVAGGDSSVGSVLTGTDAVWAETPSVQRRWLRCDSAGANCTDIPGATAATYTVTDADLGRTIRFRNDATDAQGTNSSESDVVEPYIPFLDRPAQSLGPGDRVHNGFFVRNGVESRCGVPTSAPAILQPANSFLYETFPVTSLLNEQVCVVARTAPGCVDGVSPSIYDPAFAPAAGIAANYAANSGVAFVNVASVSAILPSAGSREVVVTNGPGAGVCADYRVVLGADAPFALARPAVSGNPVEGGTLTATPGAWSGSPALGFAWLRCDAAGAACVPIEGARDGTYRVGAADALSRLRVRVTATQGRSVSSDSGPSEIVLLDPVPTGTVRLGSRNLAKAVKSGRVPVRVTCSEACTAAVQLRVTRKVARRLKLRRRLVIARASGPVPAGRAVVLRPKLVKRARKALRERKSVRFTIAATLTDSLGKTARLSRKASMKRPKKRPARRPARRPRRP
jgi:hypothetical protein